MHDTKYVEKVKTIIKDSENDYFTMHDRELAWEMIKIKIRTCSVPYFVKKKRDKQAFKSNLEKELKILQEVIDTSPTQQNHDLYSLNNFLDMML